MKNRALGVIYIPPTPQLCTLYLFVVFLFVSPRMMIAFDVMLRDWLHTFCFCQSANRPSNLTQSHQNPAMGQLLSSEQGSTNAPVQAQEEETAVTVNPAKLIVDLQLSEEHGRRVARVPFADDAFIMVVEDVLTPE